MGNDDNSGCTEEDITSVDKETIEFKVVYNKAKFDIVFPLDDSIAQLKKHLEYVTGVPVPMQKLMLKGLAKDEVTLRSLNVTKNSKVMLVGSTVSDVMSVSAPDPKALKEEMNAEEAAKKEPLCKQKIHKAVLEKYSVPDDAIIGIKNQKDTLPSTPISGMINKNGGKVRLTFKLELDQLWIGTKERTDKIPMNSIRNVLSEVIEGNEEYHIMGIQLGTTEASRVWIYYVPAQFVDSIKDAILGKWQLF